MDAVADLTRYLEARLAECLARPDLCAHASAAYRAVLADVRAGKDAGDLFALARADSLDRYANLARSHERLGDERKARANQICFDAAERATGHADLVLRLTKANDAAMPLELAANRAGGLVSQLLDAVPLFLTGTPSEKQAAKLRMKTAWQELRTIEPGFTPARIRAYPPYRSRVPFDDARLAQIERAIEQGVR